MTGWSLPTLFDELHKRIESDLEAARRSFHHPGAKGDASEGVWRGLLQSYLPQRYQVGTAHVADSTGRFSEQIDVVIFDRQYTPFIFTFQDQMILPAESVYAAFETKQSIDADLVAYARRKVASVRQLVRTNLPVPHAGGTHTEPRPLLPILGGLLALESEWRPSLGPALLGALTTNNENERLDIGCIAAHGTFEIADDGSYKVVEGSKPATRFLLEMIARLQPRATVPVIDVRAYGEWLKTP